MTRLGAFTREELQSSTVILFTERRPVRFQDVDAAGTLFYPRLLEYFSDAYLGLLAGGATDLRGGIIDGSFLTPIVHAEADYLAPLRFGDTVTIEIANARMSDRSFRLGFRATRQDGAIAAVGQVVYVTMDRVTARSVPLPEKLCDKLAPAAG